MNANLFRLVFNRKLGMYVPAHEGARSRGKKGGGAMQAATVLAALIAAFPAMAELPVACGGGPCGVNVNPTAFVTSGAAGYAVNGNLGVVTQTTDKAILNWQSFNVGKDQGVIFGFQNSAGVMPDGASFSTLNRIWQGSPSEIAGFIRIHPGQNGQLYLINQNGILFKDGAQVNTGGLVASTLDIDDSLFRNGITSNLKPDEVAAFSAAAGAAGGMVRVEEGAELRTETGGRVLLLAENVENHGLIETPEGQTILAAGSKVYLAVSGDPQLRGFLVEVDSPASGGGAATNTGRIIAERGNISMAGFTVNQSGRLTATTSVNLNGSIRLLARDSVESYTPPARAGEDAVAIPLGARTGTLVFGENSVTEVLPETGSSATITDEQVFNRSSIEGVGRTVHVKTGSVIHAPSGEIRLSAQAGKLFRNDGEAAAAGVRLQVDEGAVLDAAGLTDVQIPVERNYIQVELRGAQLQDSPLQRDTFLYKSKVWIDIEQGTPLANVDADIAKVARTVAEKSAAGGSIALQSENELVLNAGAILDVSGGSIAYQAGYGKTSKLVLNGQVVDIGEARPDVLYDGFADQYSVTDAKWGVTRTWDMGQQTYIPAYVSGRDAGEISLSGHRLLVDATLRGERVVGERQRTAPPQAGALKISGLAATGTAAAELQDFRFVQDGLMRQVAFAEDMPAGMRTELLISADMLRAGGFGRIEAASQGRLVLPEEVTVQVAAGGKVALSARRMDIDGDIVAPGGAISLSTGPGNGEISFNAADYGLTIGATALLDAAGRWSNDSPALGGGVRTDAVVINGGSISVKSHADLTLASGSVLDVSGGGWLRTSGKVKNGNAGSIKLASGEFLPPGVFEPVSLVRLDGELRGHALGDGGSLSLTASRLYLGGSGSGAAGEVVLGEAFFRQGGFKDFALTGRSGVTLADGFVLQPEPQTAVLDPGFSLHASGSRLADFTRLTTLDADMRAPTSVSLTASDFFRGDIVVGEGAVVRVDPQGEIRLNASNQLTVLGTLEARAGTIRLEQPDLLDTEEDLNNFDAGRSIFLGADSRLLAGGYYRAEPDAQGLRKGAVLDGGMVDIKARKGYLVMQEGALIDVSGTSATLDMLTAGGLTGVTVASHGGSVELLAREGMLLEGGFAAHAGGVRASGGSLAIELALDIGDEWKAIGDQTLANILRTQRVVGLNAAATGFTAAMAAGDDLNPAAFNGRADISAAQIAAAGFADVRLTAEHRVRFNESVALNLPGTLLLQAPNIEAAGNAQVSLNAAVVQIANPDRDSQAETLRNDASGGAARLDVSADLIELAGHVSLQGVDTLNLTSRGDVRLRGVVYDADLGTGNTDVKWVYDGSLAVGGDLNLAARQIYPVSMTDFALEIHNNPDGRIRITSTGEDSPVLSAGGALRLSAPFIEQGGALKAPFGAIALTSETITRVTNVFDVNGLPTGINPVTVTRAETPDGRVDLLPGSLTSVSAEGQVIPLGRTELSGADWIYDFGGFKRLLDAPPEKQIVLQGNTVDLAEGAVVNLSGGGDLLAYEFLLGPGGSSDILLPENGKGWYAVLPGLNPAYAPYDLQESRGEFADAGYLGASVQLLEGAQGLPAGTYTLLPARYALLPGAYLVRVNTADSDMSAGQGSRLDIGSSLVAGYVGTRTAGGGFSHNGRTETLEVGSGDLARQFSEYIETPASAYFAGAAGAQLPGDAGRLSIAVGEALNLDGYLLADYAAGMRGSEVDIAAYRLAVTAGGESYADGYVTLSASQLQAFGAASLLLGGVRSISGDGERVEVEQRSAEVVIAGGAELVAPELMLVATGTVKLEDGAVVAGEGVYSGVARDVHVSDAQGQGDGALLRVSSGEAVRLTRAGAALVNGVLDIDEGATVRAGRSAILDATKDNLARGALILPQSGGALTLGARRISLAEDGAAMSTDGLVFDQTRLAALGNPSDLLLRSYSTLDVYGSVHLGGAGLNSLAVEAAGLAGYGSAGDSVTLQATHVSFANPDGIPAAGAFTGTPGTASLVVEADTVTLGAGDFTLRGFDAATFNARGEILGRGGSLKVAAGGGAAGDLVLNAGRITVAAGADQIIEADGSLVTGLPADMTGTASAALGGKLELTGASVTHGGRIEMPAGVVTLRATSGDVRLAGGEILAGGRTVAFADTRAHAGGGRVSLIAEQGAVTMDGDARIDVAGSLPGGDAGELAVWAAGNATLAGELFGDAAAGFTSGRFMLTADRINPDAQGDNDFSALNTVLNAGGFHGARQIRVREGDIEIAAGDQVVAHEVLISADAGDLTVRGGINADGGKGGRIELYAGKDLTLIGAQLSARATDSVAAAEGTAGEGGLVLLSSGDAGVLSLQSGGGETAQATVIDVGTPEGSAARAGRVVLRAARTGSGAGTGVALGPLEAQIIGAGRVDVEAYKVYGGITELVSGSSSGSRLGLDNVNTDNNSFAGAVDMASLLAGLDAGTAAKRLLPGVEVRNNGGITLSGDWNLSGLRHGGEAGVLTIRAGGNLDLNASLSDGFSTAASSGALLNNNATWSYRLTAGADLDSAALLATGRMASGGNITLAADKLLRTGTGDIELAAAGDVVLAGGAAIYTAGIATANPAGFTVSGVSGNAFPTGGGDVRITAGGAVRSDTGPSGLLTDWLYRAGNLSPSNVFYRDPALWPQIAQFKNGIAALGGGDVTITSGGAVSNLLVATVANKRLPGDHNARDVNNLLVQGGGDLSIRAGGDIEGGVFYVDRGRGVVISDGQVTAGKVRGGETAATVLALGDASLDLRARTGITLESVISPTLVPQTGSNISSSLASRNVSFFTGYGADSAVRLSSLAGDVALNNDQASLAAAFGVTAGNALLYYPGTLEAAALQGSVRVREGFTLMQSSTGNLRLLAGDSVEMLGNSPIHLSDQALSTIPLITSPLTSTSQADALNTIPALEKNRHSAELLHANDAESVYVVALTGDIRGRPSPYVFAYLPKAAVFQAGRDIADVTLIGQNMREEDVTRFMAGRDIRFGIERDALSGAINSLNEARIAIGGPGRVELIAGRDIDLGTSLGVVTRGNLTNPYLPEGSADLLVLAGAAARDKNGNILPVNAALMDDPVLRNFFAELLASAAESAQSKDYSRGEAAIEALFPTGTAEAPLTYQGDISLFFSQIKTEQGGDILMLAPGGGINAGLASVTGFNREASKLGIMTVLGGDIQAYTLGDFLVNSSRVFTISGGDVLIWSAEGNIDAGKGAKTANATPPPRLRIDAKGNFVLDVSQSISGSGIGALTSGSDVYLVAPRGEVNAGDAGIRAGGNLTIAAERVVGADNIQVGGISTGVPVADTGGLASGLSGAGNLTDASNAGESATKALAGSASDAENSSQLAKQMLAGFKPNFITVEVLGFGGTGDADSDEEKRKQREEERRRGGGQGV